MIRNVAIGILWWAFLNPLSAFSETLFTGNSDGMKYRVELVADGLGVPWAMAFINESQIIITERKGSLKLLDLINGKIHAIKEVPAVFSKGQGGLLDVALSPDYKKGGWIYFTYSKPADDNGVTAFARAKLNGTSLGDWNDLLVTNSFSELLAPNTGLSNFL